MRSNFRRGKSARRVRTVNKPKTVELCITMRRRRVRSFLQSITGSCKTVRETSTGDQPEARIDRAFRRRYITIRSARAVVFFFFFFYE